MSRMERSSTFSLFDRRPSSFRRSSVSLASNLLRRSSSSVSAEGRGSSSKKYPSSKSAGGDEPSDGGGGSFLKTEKWRVLAKKVLGSEAPPSDRRPPLPPRANNASAADDPNDSSPNSSSPVGKKRGFGGRWLPNIRKLSQGKLDKGSEIQGASSSTPPRHHHLPLLKQGSKSKILGNNNNHNNNLNHNVVSSSAASTSNSSTSIQKTHSFSGPGEDIHQSSSIAALSSSSSGGGGSISMHQSKSSFSNAAAEDEGHKQQQPHDENEEIVVEVPPPMEPISSIPPPSAPGGGNNNPSPPVDGLDMSECSLSDNNNKVENEDSTLVCDSSHAPESGDESGSSNNSVASALTQRQYRLNELLDSEKMYVKDLEQTCMYINFMKEAKENSSSSNSGSGGGESVPMPEDLKEGKDRMIFGNIEAIYEWHRDFFSKNLEKCIQNPIELGNLFKKYDRKFQMYVVYCQNKPKSEYIVSEYIDTYFEEIRNKLGFKLRLTDLLIKPVQRLTKYHMLLEAILKYSQRAGMLEEAEAISRAFHVMTIVPNQANDMMDIGRLQGFEGKITAQGKLLYRGPLSCLDNFSGGPVPNGGGGGGGSTAKMKPFTVFLFEQIMIFSETVGKKTQFTSPVYVYVAHFLVNKMSLEENVDEGHPCKFMIRSTDPARDALNILCQTEDSESRDKWISIIKRQLQTQMDFLRALQAPIAYHNNKLAKN